MALGKAMDTVLAWVMEQVSDKALAQEWGWVLGTRLG